MMDDQDKELLSALLDGELSGHELETLLHKVHQSPELLEYYNHLQYHRAVLREGYCGRPLDLSARLRQQLQGVQEDNVLLLQTAYVAPQAVNDSPGSESETAVNSSLVNAERHLGPVKSSGRSSFFKRFSGVQSLVQLGVAASVCFAILSVWTLQTQNMNTPVESAIVADVTEVEQLDMPRTLAQVSTATTVATDLRKVPAVGQAAFTTVSSASRPYSTQYAAGLPASALSEQNNTVLTRSRVVSLPRSDVVPSRSNMVSVATLSPVEQSKLNSYYLLHTGNVVLHSSAGAVDFARVVDLPVAADFVSTATGVLDGRLDTADE